MINWIQKTPQDYEQININPFQVPNPNDPPSNIKIFSCIDMDAFYAQAEGRRLGYDDTVPVVVVQWTLTIAVSYAVRKFGVTRMMPVPEIRKLCPHAVFIHVDTIKANEPYVDPYKRNLKDKLNINRDINTEKVSLDYFRCENDRIVDVFKKWCSRVEKASVDESYLDLTQEVYEIYNRGDYEKEWKCKFAGGEPYPPETKEDILLMIGSQLVDRIRKDILDTFKYTCSGGISYNKMLAKLAAGINKPNDQTVIVKKYADVTLKPIKIRKLRNFGGKVSAAFENTQYKTLEDLQGLSMSQLEDIMQNPQSAKYVYYRCRGFDDEEVKPKNTATKTLMSTKTWNKGITEMAGIENAVDLALGDLCPRIIEFFHQSKKVPSALDLYYYCNKTKTNKWKSGPINLMTKEENFYEIVKTRARDLTNQVVDDLFPCKMLGLLAKNFVKNDLKSYGFDLLTYAKNKQKEKQKKEEQEAKQALKQRENLEMREESMSILENRLEESLGFGEDDMNNFFRNEEGGKSRTLNSICEGLELGEDDQEKEKGEMNKVKETILCEKCNILIDKDGFTDHYDFHVAQDLDKELNPNKRKYRKLENDNTVMSFQESIGNKGLSSVASESKDKPNQGKNKSEDRKKTVNGKMKSIDSFFGKK